MALLNLYFRVRLAEGKLRARDDVTELQWFSLDNLPDNIAFESDRFALRVLRAGHGYLPSQDPRGQSGETP